MENLLPGLPILVVILIAVVAIGVASERYEKRRSSNEEPVTVAEKAPAPAHPKTAELSSLEREQRETERQRRQGQIILEATVANFIARNRGDKDAQPTEEFVKSFEPFLEKPRASPGYPTTPNPTRSRSRSSGDAGSAIIGGMIGFGIGTGIGSGND